MSAPGGYNPMRWVCAERGCYNVKHRPKIEMFAECFPGRISMGDVDGLVEINRQFLLLEWKSVEKELPAGQRITYERMTLNSPVVVLVVTGNPETMQTDSYSMFWKGRQLPKVNADLDAVKERIKAWVSYAQSHKAA